MNAGKFIRNIVVPIFTVATGLLVVVLNYAVSTNEQESKERFGELDRLIKSSSEERAQRESSQAFNLKIYEIVTRSLEEQSAQKQEAAKAFIVVMVDEPLRSSLLNVLRHGGDSKVGKEIGKILKEEARFKNPFAFIPRGLKPVTSPSASHDWGKWDLDIFWCTTSGAKAQNMATMIGEQLIAEGAKGRVRVRELPDSINSRQGYQIEGFVIRRNSNEKTVAEALKSLSEKTLSKTGEKLTFTIGLTRQATPWYISTFICP